MRSGAASRCWWLTGLPGAGKTTLAQALASALRADGQAVCVLDGDELRQGLCTDLGFDAESRHEQMRRVAEIVRVLHHNGIQAIVALVSPTVQGRQAARQAIGPERFREVHVATPLAVCQARDPKGLYARAKTDPAFGLTGVQADYQAPIHPDLILDTSRVGVAQALIQLLALG